MIKYRKEHRLLNLTFAKKKTCKSGRSFISARSALKLLRLVERVCSSMPFEAVAIATRNTVFQPKNLIWQVDNG
jgi:hypothetical protein